MGVHNSTNLSAEVPGSACGGANWCRRIQNCVCRAKSRHRLFSAVKTLQAAPGPTINGRTLVRSIPHPISQQLIAALESARGRGLNFALARGYRDLPTHIGRDLDLLVARGDATALQHHLEEALSATGATLVKPRVGASLRSVRLSWAQPEEFHLTIDLIWELGTRSLHCALAGNLIHSGTTRTVAFAEIPGLRDEAEASIRQLKRLSHLLPPDDWGQLATLLPHAHPNASLRVWLALARRTKTRQGIWSSIVLLPLVFFPLSSVKRLARAVRARLRRRFIGEAGQRYVEAPPGTSWELGS